MNIMHPGIWQALYLKWRYKIPYVVSENWHGFQDLAKYNLSFLEMKLIKLGFRFSSVISPVSKQLKNCMIVTGGPKRESKNGYFFEDKKSGIMKPKKVEL